MLSYKEQIQLAAKLLSMTEEEAGKNSEKIGNSDAVLVGQPVKGGGTIIVDTDGSVLYAISAVSYEEHVKAFFDGIRTPLEAFGQ